MKRSESTPRPKPRTVTPVPSKGPLVIHDPVHGYITLAPHERPVLDHRLTQRLRHIRQTGLAEYVYPEARTSRFAHSLGAMHMASRFFVKAIENAAGSVAKRFLDEVAGACGYTADKAPHLVVADGKAVLESARLHLPQPELRSPHYLSLVQALECALRFAALFHDLGHLPFSHDFELSLREYLHASEADLDESLVRLAESPAPHELIGKELADLVFADLTAADRTTDDSLLHLSRLILTAHCDYSIPDSLPMGALGWLHSIIDGDVDADRADFLLRDGRALGLDFSHYDVDRLAPHVVLAEDDTLGFITAVDERTLSPLESFFLARARTYQVLVRHHKVAQVAAALRFASAEALARDACRKPREYLTMIGAGDIRKTGRGQEVVEAFALVDDGWWIQILRDLPAAPGSPLAAALGLVLRRERGITSVWKRRGDLTDSQLVEVNTLAGIARNDVDLRFERQRRELAARGIFVLAHRFRPYAKIIRGPDQGQSLVYVRTRLGLRPASRLSPIFKSLTEIWENEVHLQAFSVEELGIDATLAELRIE